LSIFDAFSGLVNIPDPRKRSYEISFQNIIVEGTDFSLCHRGVTKPIELRWKKGYGSENIKAGNWLEFQGKRGSFGGGADQDRTGDLLNAIHLCPQLPIQLIDDIRAD